MQDGEMGIRAEKAEERCRLLAERRSSGMTRGEFCELRQIRLTTFASWERAERKLGKRRLLPVKIQSDTKAAAESGRSFALSLSNGRRIECDWRLADADLVRLIRAAESA